LFNDLHILIFAAIGSGQADAYAQKTLLAMIHSIPTRREAVMNLKCYKSVILAPTSPLLLTERLKILQQAAICVACCNIWVRPGR
jgi:hypothetical protein